MYWVPVGTNPSIPLVGVTTNEVPVQMVLIIVLMEGGGITKTVTVNWLPVQLATVGVT